MKFNEAKKIVKDMQKASEEIADMVTIMGVYAVNFYKKSFDNQGFTDETLELWKKRKSKRDNNGRNILIKTGRLKRSLTTKKLGRYQVKIVSNVPYAVIHNEGGNINKKERSHILNFNEGGKFQRQRTRKQRNETSYSQKVNVSSHSIKIPKRQFVGYSSQLARKIELKLDSKLRAIFK